MKTTLTILGLIVVTAALIVTLITFSSPDDALNSIQQTSKSEEKDNNEQITQTSSNSKNDETVTNKQEEGEQKESGINDIRSGLRDAVQGAIDEEVQKAVRDELSRTQNDNN